MRTYRGPRVESTILGAASLLAIAMGGGTGPSGSTERFELAPPTAVVAAEGTDPALTGTWVSTDDEVWLRLDPDASYQSRVAGRKRAAHGTYRVSGASIVLRDHSGLQTEATVTDEAIELAGHVLLPA